MSAMHKAALLCLLVPLSALSEGQARATAHAAAHTMAPGDAGERRAVLESFQGFLDALGRRDKEGMLSRVAPGGTVALMRDGKPMQMSLEALADKLSKPGPATHEERISDPLVRIDHDIAIIWARFEFRLDGKIDHCGRDVANMVKVDGRWLIAFIQDNNRRDCGAGSD